VLRVEFGDEACQLFLACNSCLSRGDSSCALHIGVTTFCYKSAVSITRRKRCSLNRKQLPMRLRADRFIVRVSSQLLFLPQYSHPTSRERRLRDLDSVTGPSIFKANRREEPRTQIETTGAQMNFITVKDGTQIYFKDWGTGQPIFFHHGWPLSADDWDAQMMFFLERGYRVIAHDRRGHGRSTQTFLGHDMDTYAADVAELVEALDLKNSVHIGHSTGGGEGTRFVARHGAGRVVKAVLISAIPPTFMQSARNPDGVPKAVVDTIRDGTAYHRSQFYQDITNPFYGF